MLASKQIHEWMTDVRRIHHALGLVKPAMLDRLQSPERKKLSDALDACAGFIGHNASSDLFGPYDIGLWIWKFFPVEALETWAKHQDDGKARQELIESISVFMATLGFGQNAHLYSPEEFITVMPQFPKEINYARLAYTLAQVADEPKNFQYVKTLLSYISAAGYNANEKYSWLETFILALSLRALWYSLRRLDDFDVAWLTSHSYYIAILCGVPVKQILLDYLYNSADAIIFLRKSKFIADALLKNTEPLAGSTDQKKAPVFGAVVKGARHHAGTADDHVLTEALEIVKGVRLLTLVGRIASDEKTDARLLSRDIDALLAAYCDGKPSGWGWTFIAKYYKEKNPRYLLRHLLVEIRTHEDLTDQASVQRVADFTQFLKEHRLLPADTDLIELHEGDGTFHWREPLET